MKAPDWWPESTLLSGRMWPPGIAVTLGARVVCWPHRCPLEGASSVGCSVVFLAEVSLSRAFSHLAQHPPDAPLLGVTGVGREDEARGPKAVEAAPNHSAGGPADLDE